MASLTVADYELFKGRRKEVIGERRSEGGRGYGNGSGDYNRRWPPMTYGYGPCGQWGMMCPYGGIFMWILFLIILALVVYLVVRWTKPAGAYIGETPLDILKKRYARGEIPKDEFEQKKKDLGL